MTASLVGMSFIPFTRDDATSLGADSILVTIVCIAHSVINGSGKMSFGMQKSVWLAELSELNSDEKVIVRTAYTLPVFFVENVDFASRQREIRNENVDKRAARVQIIYHDVIAVENCRANSSSAACAKLARGAISMSPASISKASESLDGNEERAAFKRRGECAAKLPPLRRISARGVGIVAETARQDYKLRRSLIPASHSRHRGNVLSGQSENGDDEFSLIFRIVALLLPAAL